MKIINTRLDNCLIIEPRVFGDDRGFFLETFHLKRYSEQLNFNFEFVQDNHSRSSYGVLRGLHFQNNNPQGKLVRVTRGEVFDVAIDLRKDSPSYGLWEGVYLSEDNKRQLWVPPGFAHGFVVTSEIADFEYKCTNFYDPDDEICIKWDDKDLAIDWPIKNPIISEKDSNGINLVDID